MISHSNSAVFSVLVADSIKSILLTTLTLAMGLSCCVYAQEPETAAAPNPAVKVNINTDRKSAEGSPSDAIKDTAEVSGEETIDMSSFGAPPSASKDVGDDVDAGLLSDPALVDRSGMLDMDEILIDTSGGEVQEGRFAELMKSTRISLKHEMSYKFASPKRLVNNRSSVRLEYSELFAEKIFLRLDSMLNFYWGNDHRANARDETLYRDLVTREAYLQTSLGNSSVRLGYQILPWGVSEGGAITDEISPRNASEFFFVSLEESRIGQPMLTTDYFNDMGSWTGFFVPRPAYNKYPDIGSEYDIPGAFDKPEPKGRWDDPDDFEYGLRWKRTFGKSDISLMAASLIDNDYLVRKQRFKMFGLTANIAQDNLLYRAEVALKQPKAYFASTDDGGTTIVESDQLDASLGFDYSPGGRSLVYSAELVWSRLLDWKEALLGRERDEYGLVGSVSNRYFNDDLTLSWLTIYSRPFTSFQHKFLSSYLIDDNSTVYFELFYPDERDSRSANRAYRDQKQVVFRYQYQF